MEKVPIEIQQQFFKLFLDEISVSEFEKWIYASKELEFAIGESEYHELISLNFKSRYIKDEIKTVADKFLDYGEFEKRKVQGILNDLIERNERFEKSLMATYDLRCHGYFFLDNLGMKYGLAIKAHFDYKGDEILSQYSPEIMLDEIYDDVKKEALIVMEWIDSGKIVLTGKKYEQGRYFEFIDNRK